MSGIRDTRMMARAIRERWPITPEYREAVVKALVRVVVDPETSPREKTSAAKGLIAADSQNLAEEQLLRKEQLENATLAGRLADLAGRLGIRPPGICIEPGGPVGDHDGAGD